MLDVNALCTKHCFFLSECPDVSEQEDFLCYLYTIQSGMTVIFTVGCIGKEAVNVDQHGPLSLSFMFILDYLQKVSSETLVDHCV